MMYWLITCKRVKNYVSILSKTQARTSPIDDPLLMQSKKWLSEDRIAIGCITGEELSEKDIERLHLPPSPLVPLGRHGTDSKTWLRMQLHDVDSNIRRRSG